MLKPSSFPTRVRTPEPEADVATELGRSCPPVSEELMSTGVICPRISPPWWLGVWTLTYIWPDNSQFRCVEVRDTTPAKVPLLPSGVGLKGARLIRTGAFEPGTAG